MESPSQRLSPVAANRDSFQRRDSGQGYGLPPGAASEHVGKH